MGQKSLGNELVNSMRRLKGQQAQKVIKGKDVVIGPRKSKGSSKKSMGVKRGKKEVNGPRKPEE